MKKIYLILLLSFLYFAGLAQTTTTFSTPGGPYSYTATSSSIIVTAKGGGGGNNSGSSWPSNGGNGATVVCTLAVTPGVTYFVYVGGAGVNGTSTTAGTGGANGGANGSTASGYGGGGGGGGSDIRITSGVLSSRVVVAGGGGGAGLNCANLCTGGNGGGTTASPGLSCGSTAQSSGAGQGGTPTGGGGGGSSTGASGTAGAGGAGGSGSPNGGGGGGYFGGGGGGSWAGAGGGSSYTDPGLATGVVHTAGNVTFATNGSVVITALCNAPGTISGSSGVCLGSTTTLTVSGAGGSGTWVSSDPTVATIGSASGVVTGVAAGTVTMTYSISTPCGSPATKAMTVNPLPGSITGASSVCVGNTVTKSVGISGGTWSTTNSSVAAIGTASGIITGVSAGSVTIDYTLPTGCASTPVSFTVNPSPAAITGTGTICGGSNPTSITLSNGTSGGTWSSSNTALATVGSTSGVVTGVASGSPTISYTLPAGCFSVTTVVVNAVAPITGPASTCLGNTATLGNLTPGGTWSSSNTAVGTINSSGVVTSISNGTTNITYNVSSLGCSAVLPFYVTGTPSTYAVTGGGSYCAGGVGVNVGVNTSDAGVVYTLFNGATPAGTVVGTGSSVSFGFKTASGTYTVVANYGTPCATTMSGSAVITVDPLPTAFSVTGGGSYCAGGSGVHIYLSTSTIGVSYQLMLGGTPVGSPIAGTSTTIDFGLHTTAGTYTVVATNMTTSCVNNMTGSATVSINPLPTAFSVTGGGGFCLGGAGVHIGVSGSATGTTYQLLISGSPVGSPLAGTGSSLDFGFITTAGLYTVLATNTATGCTNSMSGAVTVTVNPLPTVFTVTGGGAYCLGGTGVVVGLNGSTAGVNYQLFLGSTPVGSPVAGTGVAISFGLQTTTGSYTVVATNTTTGCVNNMFSSVSVSTSPLPTLFNVTGGGGYCAGGTGVAVGLSGSTVGTTYSLYNGATLVSAASGTGAPISFGLQLGAGTYTVVGVNGGTGCTANMSGSVTVVINPLPTVFTVTGGGNYCATGTGVVVGLGSSEVGVNYQLYNGSTPVGATVPGTGAAISFGLQTGAGSYTVRAINASTTCTANMSGSAVIVVNPLPTVYTVTGGGGYCAGGAGLHVGLSASNTGISYQLFRGGTPELLPITGTGTPIDFGVFATPGLYTIVATNTTTACPNNMSGSATISINALPTAHTVTSTGTSYCAGGTGVSFGLNSSNTGISYQLYIGSTASGTAVAGTGAAISFGPRTAAGTYTVVGTNTSTTCSNNMIGSIAITIDPLPAAFAVTGGGNYCSGGAGMHVGLSGSALGIEYQLMNGLATVGTPVTGTGGTLDFGLQTVAGNYTVVATNVLTGCTSNMTGSATIVVNALPGLYTITGGGNYCAGGTGVAVGLSGSAIGISYQLMLGGSPVGAPMLGTGLALNFGMQTGAGVYTIVGTNMATGCVRTMTGTTTIVINSLPTVYAVTGGGSYCVGASGVAIGLGGSDAGTNYQLYNGTVAVGAPVPGTSLPISFGMQTGLGLYTVVATNTSTMCSGNMSGTATVGTYPLPVVYNITGGGNYCSGGPGVNVGLSGSNIGISYQLFNGTSPAGSPVSGTGLAISFGLQTTAGNYTVVATNTTTSCSNTMNGIATVGISALPTAYTVTGGGNYCAGGAGLHIGLSGSNTGISYQLYNGMTAIGAPVPGTGSALDFGVHAAPSTYTVVATNISTTCINTMTGSVTIAIDPLPNAHTLTGGGNYCSGGTGVNITLGGSDPGIDYQLYNGTTPVGVSMPGTGFSIAFGLQTAAGTYTVVGTDAATTCNNTMAGSVVVTIDPLPTTYIVGGGGNYCAGGSGVHVTLSGSNTGISYQLLVDGLPTGSAVMGTGLGLDFGSQTTGGTYTVEATNSVTGCVNTMTGSVVIVVNPLPTVYPVSSTSSNYCVGGAGVHIWLNSSDPGVNYQLYIGSTAVGMPVVGAGSAVDFGFLLPAGLYSVIAVNPVTGCADTMASSVAVVINPLPTVYTVTGGGGYCDGSSGVLVGLSGSNTGVLYELRRGGSPTGIIIPGTGSSISFGLQTIAGTYTVIANNPATTCVNNMSGSTTVAINTVPSLYIVTGGGNYCAGGTGVSVGLSGSALGINYQLYRGTALIGGPVAGTGGALSFGMQTASGNYTVVATNAATGCTNTMTGSATVAIDAAPTAYTVTGGGNYCPGGSGVNVGLGGSDLGITYQLWNGTTPVGSAMPGTGSSINFGLQTAAGTYTVKATNTVTGCTGSMSGTATVVINPVPSVYAVSGGGNYCAGGSGVHVGLSNSNTGINYTLYTLFSTVVTLPGTGAPLDFGLQTAAGTYTVIATNAATGCASNMSGSVTVVINPTVIPAVSITTGVGDTVCDGSFVTFNAMAVNGGSSPVYQWTVNGASAAVGSSYSYMPVNGDVIGVMLTSSEMCAVPASVSSSKTMTVDPRMTPVVTVGVNPGTVVCQGTTVTFTASPSFGGNAPTYTWVKNGVNSATSSTYSYIPVNGDIVYCMMNSNYHCRLANTATSSHINMQVDVPALPVVTITANPGLSIAAGQAATFTASVVNGGPTPSYQWLVNGSPVSGAVASTFVTATLNNNDSVTCQVLSSGGCPGLLGFNSVRMHIHGVGVQNVGSSASDIVLVPNPNKGVFTVKGTLGIAADEDVTIEITNMLGQTIYNGKTVARNGELNERIELSSVANGMYILSLRSGNEHKVFHVVIEQ